MGLCKDCLHREVCESWTTINLDDIPPEVPCGHFKDTADVAPRADVEMWLRECEELQGRMIEVEKELRKEIATEIFRLIEDECLCYPLENGFPTMLVDRKCYEDLKKEYTEGKK